MNRHPTLYLTNRQPVHQQMALAAAPTELEIIMRPCADRSEIMSLLPKMEFLISERSGKIDSEMIAAGKNLRLIQRLGAQTWDIDLPEAQRNNIPVCYWPLATCVMVAEHVLLQMLSLLKRSRELVHVTLDVPSLRLPMRCDENTFAYNWSERAPLGSLREATVGIMGLGEIGLELARRLQPFGCIVQYYKRKRLPALVETEYNLVYANSPSIQAEADIVCSLLPYTSETAQTLNVHFFATLRPGAYFVHCGGSGVVDEDALVAALRDRRLSGAALDTFSVEPFPQNHPLIELARDPTSNLFLTPHVAAGVPHPGWRKEEYTNLINLLNGLPLLHRVV